MGTFTKTTTLGSITWTARIVYTLTPSTDLSSFTVKSTLSVKRSDSTTAWNEVGTSYATYTINGVASSKVYKDWEVSGGAWTTVSTYTTTVKANDIDYSVGIPVSVYWYTGVKSADYTPESMTITGNIAIPNEYAGIIHIGNGTSWDKYEVYVGDGTKWIKCIPYVGDGTKWVLCN